jgi:hypothetical protein
MDSAEYRARSSALAARDLRVRCEGHLASLKSENAVEYVEAFEAIAANLAKIEAAANRDAAVARR